MDLNLETKKVFVSGSSRGIGLGIARKFLDEGANVVINSRNEKDLSRTSSVLGKCDIVSGDVSDPNDAKRIIAQASEILGGIDVLVCNVGSGTSVPVGSETYDEWQRVFDVNFCTHERDEVSAMERI